MATQIRVEPQNGNAVVYLEVPDSQPMTANLQFKDIQDLKAKGNHTFSFRIPSTPVNNLFFNSYFEVTQFGNYNPRKKVEATILKNTLDVFSGYLQLTNVICSGDEIYYYECVVFSSIATLGQVLEKKKLASCDWSSYDHALTMANVTDSFSQSFMSGDLVYSIYDYGSNFVGGSGTESMTQESGAINIRNLKPQIRLKKVFDKILTESGFTYTSEFLDTTMSDLYMDLNNGSSTINDFNAWYYNVVLSVSGTASFTPTAGFQDIVFSVLTTGTGTNSSGNYNTTNGVYTPDNYWNSTYWSAGFQISNSGSFTSADRVRICWCKYDATTSDYTNVVYQSSIIQLGLLGANDVSIFDNNANLFIDTTSASYKVRLKIITVGSSSGNWTISAGQIQIHPNANYGSPVYSGYGNLDGFDATYVFKASYNFPDITCLDFLNSLIKKFNLVVIPDKYQPTHLNIIPYVDWIQQGKEKDWTEFLDVSKDVQLKPTAELQAKVLTLTDSDSDDYWNKTWKQQVGRTYGSTVVLNDNDFGKEKEEIKTVFKPTITRHIFESGFRNSVCFVASDEEAKGTRLSFYCGNVASDNDGESWYISDGVTTTELDNYPLLQNYKDANPTPTTQCITFNGEATGSLALPVMINGAYKVYWERFILETYSSDARLMTATFFLSSLEIMNFNFNDIIFIKNDKFRINNIKNYPLTGKGTCSIELIKVQDVGVVDASGNECNAVPSQYYIQTDGLGVVEFQDSSTAATVTITQACCESYVDAYWGTFSWLNGQCYYGSETTPMPDPEDQQFYNDAGKPNGGNNATQSGLNSVIGYSNSTTKFTSIKGNFNEVGLSSNNLEISGDYNTIKQSTSFSSIKGSNNRIEPYQLEHKSTRVPVFNSQIFANTSVVGDYGIPMANGDVTISGGADSLYNRVGRSGSGHFVKHCWTTDEEKILIGQDGEFTVDTTDNASVFNSYMTNAIRLQYPSIIGFELVVVGHNRGTTSNRSQVFTYRKFTGVINNTSNSGRIKVDAMTTDIQKESSEFSNYTFNIQPAPFIYDANDYVNDGMFYFDLNTNGCTKLDNVDWTIDFRYSLVGLQNMSRSAGSRIFTPTGITGCLLWLDAADESTFTFNSGTDISQWDDKSGNNHDFVNIVSGTYPTFSDLLYDTYVQFGASNVGLVNQDSSLYDYSDSDNTIFVVFMADSSSDGGRYGHHIAGDSNRGRQTNGIFGEADSTYGGGGVGFVGYTNNNIDRTCDSNNLAPTTKQVVCGTYDGSTTVKFYNQNGLQNTKTTGITTSSKDQFAVGGGKASGTTVTSEFDGKIYEVIVYDTELTDAQREQVFNYLETKWNT